jgi:hypothetical protein
MLRSCIRVLTQNGRRRARGAAPRLRCNIGICRRVRVSSAGGCSKNPGCAGPGCAAPREWESGFSSRSRHAFSALSRCSSAATARAISRPTPSSVSLTLTTVCARYKRWWLPDSGESPTPASGGSGSAAAGAAVGQISSGLGPSCNATSCRDITSMRSSWAYRPLGGVLVTQAGDVGRPSAPVVPTPGLAPGLDLRAPPD